VSQQGESRHSAGHRFRLVGGVHPDSGSTWRGLLVEETLGNDILSARLRPGFVVRAWVREPINFNGHTYSRVDSLDESRPLLLVLLPHFLQLEHHRSPSHLSLHL